MPKRKLTINPEATADSWYGTFLEDMDDDRLVNTLAYMVAAFHCRYPCYQKATDLVEQKGLKDYVDARIQLKLLEAGFKAGPEQEKGKKRQITL